MTLIKMTLIKMTLIKMTLIKMTLIKMTLIKITFYAYESVVINSFLPSVIKRNVVLLSVFMLIVAASK